MKKAIALLCIFLVLTQTISFAQTVGDPEALRRETTGLVRGIGKLFRTIAKFFSGKKAGKVLDTIGGVAEGAADQAFDGRYAPKKDDEQVVMENTKPNEPRKYTITFINNTDFSVSVRGYGESITLPPKYFNNGSVPSRHSIETEEQHRRGWDYTLLYDDNKVTWTPEGDRDVTFRDRKEFHGSYKDEETDVTEEYLSLSNRNIPASDSIENAPVNQPIEIHAGIPDNTFAMPENDPVNQPIEIHTEVPTPHFNQNVPRVHTIPDAEIEVKNPHADYTEHVPTGEPVTRRTAIAPQQPRHPLPLISNFQMGMYYVQIGSYANVNTAYSEIAKIDNGLPVAVMKITVKINGIDKEVHRILIGPLDYEKSVLLLRQFRVNYHDAFVWQGR